MSHSRRMARTHILSGPEHILYFLISWKGKNGETFSDPIINRIYTMRVRVGGYSNFNFFPI